MSVNQFFEYGHFYRVTAVEQSSNGFIIHVVPRRRSARCDLCGWHSRVVHSRYTRKLSHLSMAGTRTIIVLTVRRFRCRNRLCHKATFVEPATGLAARYARCTDKLRTAVQRIATVAGANPTERLATVFGVRISATTLRRRIREQVIPATAPVRVLGIDEWAWRKGQRYGSILCDLERGRIVDLLPDRSVQSVSEWLCNHPEVQLVSRDRSALYAEGARTGAPQAIQVADRFHLLRNLAETMERLLNTKRSALKNTVSTLASTVEQPAASLPERKGRPAERQPDAQSVTQGASSPTGAPAPIGPETKAAQARVQRRQVRVERYQSVIDLRQNGLSAREIARQTGLSRRTVRCYLSADQFPEIAERASRPTLLTAYTDFIRQRLAAGKITAAKLYTELRELGFTGSLTIVQRYLQDNRTGQKPRDKAPDNRYLSPKTVSKLLLQPEQERTEKDNAFLRHLRASSPAIATGLDLLDEFALMVRNRLSERYTGWLQRVRQAGISEFINFADGLEQGRATVLAGMSVPWSNGPTEGHVNRLKTIKRQMYGRGGFDMLRKRVLLAA